MMALIYNVTDQLIGVHNERWLTFYHQTSFQLNGEVHQLVV